LSFLGREGQWSQTETKPASSAANMARTMSGTLNMDSVHWPDKKESLPPHSVEIPTVLVAGRVVGSDAAAANGIADHHHAGGGGGHTLGEMDKVPLSLDDILAVAFEEEEELNSIRRLNASHADAQQDEQKQNNVKQQIPPAVEVEKKEEKVAAAAAVEETAAAGAEGEQEGEGTPEVGAHTRLQRAECVSFLCMWSVFDQQSSIYRSEYRL